MRAILLLFIFYALPLSSIELQSRFNQEEEIQEERRIDQEEEEMRQEDLRLQRQREDARWRARLEERRREDRRYEERQRSY